MCVCVCVCVCGFSAIDSGDILVKLLLNTYNINDCFPFRTMIGSTFGGLMIQYANFQWSLTVMSGLLFCCVSLTSYNQYFIKM